MKRNPTLPPYLCCNTLGLMATGKNFGFSRRDKSPSLQVFWSYLNCIDLCWVTLSLHPTYKTTVLEVDESLNSKIVSLTISSIDIRLRRLTHNLLQLLSILLQIKGSSIFAKESAPNS
ncbi:hypothetical protein [Nostoc sp. UCD121]|uniref:hypothetical protein n=1 Tax=Nostoc sp. UCD121 TaxID=2681305 RepID=UPI001627FA74|nr:hypothetical protein [Nostoc sp. UCD121]MBC1220833.1 hypothetical protein [Nostoc sp. UCD120]